MSNLNDLPKNVFTIKDAEQDLLELDHSQLQTVLKAIKKVSTNASETGYGKPLSNDLKGFCKVKIKSIGIRIVYKYLQTSSGMLIIVVGMRKDDEVYDIAKKRIKKYGL